MTSMSTFSVHPDNPRCFLYRNKPFKILTSAEHYGAVLNADFDDDVYLREMQRTGQNMTRVFTFYREVDTSIPAPGNMNTLAPRPEAAVMPWARVSGGGPAADGLDRFDLDRWNPAYFDRFRDFLAKCAHAGIICEVTLFCNPYTQDKYDLFPCSPLSNVNGVGSDLETPRAFMTLDAPGIVAFQERLVRKIVEELNPFDNLYYEICNEPNLFGDFQEANEQKILAWHAHLARVIRQTEATLPKRHLIAANAHSSVKVSETEGQTVTRHEDLGYFEDPDIDIVNYHSIAAHAQSRELNFVRLNNENAQAGLIWPFLRQRDRFEKPIVFDETFSGIVRGVPERYAVNRAEAWETLLSGGAGYNNLDWSFTPADETGAGKIPIADGRNLDGRPLREWLGYLHALLSQYDLAVLQPAIGLVPGQIPGCGYAASTDGAGKYILYIVDQNVYRLTPCLSRDLAVSLNLPSGNYTARTFDPQTGGEETLPALQSDGSATLEVPTFAEDTAVCLELQKA